MFDYIPNEYARAWVSNRFASRRGVFLPNAFVDINDGNIHDAILFSQIMYWHEPDEQGKTRLRYRHEGELGILKNHGEWFEECRIEKRTVRKCLDRLKERNLIFYEIVGFRGDQKPFIRMNWDTFSACMKSWERTQTTIDTPDTRGHTPDMLGQPTLTQGDIPLTQHVTSLFTETTHRLQTESSEKDISQASNDAASTEKPLPENIVQQITDILVKKDAELLPAKSKRKKKQPLDIDAEYKKLVRNTFNAWGTRTEGVASMLLALADDGEYKRYMLDPVMSFEELKAYQFWQNRTSDKEFRPQRAETIYNWIDKWRNTKEYQQWLQKQQQPEPAPVTQPVSIVQEPDFESVDIIQKIWDDALARGENPALAAMQYAAQKLSANSSDLKARAKEAQHVSATEPEKA